MFDRVWAFIGTCLVVIALDQAIGWWAVLGVLGVQMMIDGTVDRKRGNAWDQ